MANFTWTNAAGGNWSIGANWDPGTVPGNGANIVLPTLAGAYTSIDDLPFIDGINLSIGNSVTLIIAEGDTGVENINAFGTNSLFETQGNAIVSIGNGLGGTYAVDGPTASLDITSFNGVGTFDLFSGTVSFGNNANLSARELLRFRGRQQRQARDRQPEQLSERLVLSRHRLRLARHDRARHEHLCSRNLYERLQRDRPYPDHSEGGWWILRLQQFQHRRRCADDVRSHCHVYHGCCLLRARHDDPDPRWGTAGREAASGQAGHHPGRWRGGPADRHVARPSPHRSRPAIPGRRPWRRSASNATPSPTTCRTATCWSRPITRSSWTAC